jgi:hypothetical protein
MKFIRNAIFLFLGCFTLVSTAQDFDGYALYNLQNNSTAYLIDKDGNIAKSWECNNNANYSLFLKNDGNLVRQGVSTSAQLRGAAHGGILEEYDKDGNVVWSFTYSTADHQSHHDFTVLPNGNVLLTAWEVKSITELLAAGKSSTSEKWPTHIVEVEQDGTGGKIVWEWHIWDHMIQDVENTKPNFGVVADHPELMNINVAGQTSRKDGDWFHVNGIDYNAELDQIAFTSRFMSEIFIIDHSTTTAEAASHIGGNAGKGGDFLFRYGNPANYGSSVPKAIASAVHDVRWIKNDGRPNGGWLQFFNNTGGSGGNSVVDAINPIMDGYNYTFSGGSYQPTAHEWRHECKANSSGQSASDRLSNGNVFVAVSRQYMYEVDSTDNIVWQYSDGPPKGFRRECANPGIIALLDNPCDVAISGVDDLEANAVIISPNPSYGTITISGLEDMPNFQIQVIDMLGKVVLRSNNQTELSLRDLENGQYIISILTENTLVTKSLILAQ